MLRGLTWPTGARMPPVNSTLQGKRAADNPLPGSDSRNPRRGPREAHGAGASEARGFEGGGTRTDGGAGGDHVIHQNQRNPLQPLFRVDLREERRVDTKCVLHVQRSIHSARSYLSAALLSAIQRCPARPAELASECFSEEPCLVVSALPQAGRGERNGYQQRRALSQAPRSRRHVSPHPGSERRPAPVFQPVYQGLGRRLVQKRGLGPSQLLGPRLAFAAPVGRSELREPSETTPRTPGAWDPG